MSIWNVDLEMVDLKIVDLKIVDLKIVDLECRSGILDRDYYVWSTPDTLSISMFCLPLFTCPTVLSVLRANQRAAFFWIDITS